MYNLCLAFHHSSHQDGYLKVYVSAVEHPEHFWLQVVGSKALHLEKLQTDLTAWVDTKEAQEVGQLLQCFIFWNIFLSVLVFQFGTLASYKSTFRFHTHFHIKLIHLKCHCFYYGGRAWFYYELLKIFLWKQTLKPETS